ncbi:MAG TPA: PCP reductase family protein [Gemmatimonadales bacterium]|nr:PCP reductase family protein [Gemmatimonadales bacterium]
MDRSQDERLAALEARLGRIEALLERSALEHDAVKHGIQTWVTDYVSLRLQQLVPETCEHPPAAEIPQGPVLPGTAIPCTEEVVHRLGRIPIPFVRQMVTQKVAETARAEHVTLVDVAFFERAATF